MKSILYAPMRPDRVSKGVYIRERCEEITAFFTHFAGIHHQNTRLDHADPVQAHPIWALRQPVELCFQIIRPLFYPPMVFLFCLSGKGSALLLKVIP